jgi:hypothetical protein
MSNCAPRLEAAKFARHSPSAESSLELPAYAPVARSELEHELAVVDIADSQLKYRCEVPRLLQREACVSLGEDDVFGEDPGSTAWGPHQDKALIGYDEIVRRARTEQQRHPPT